MKHFPELRRALWRLRRSITDLRLAKAEARVQQLRFEMHLIDLEGSRINLEELCARMARGR